MRLLAVVLLTFATTILHAQEKPEFTFHANDLFDIQKIASSEQAHDIQVMTLDRQGEVVVSGPGYIRRLTDKDGDGLLEKIETLYPGPRVGAQGLLFAYGYLYFVGGKGLMRIPEKELGPEAQAELVLPFAVGGEHHAHAVRQGADGALYLIGGNFCRPPIDKIRKETSPILDPYAGVMLRLDPDGKWMEVIGDGLRNTYDFDFNADGEIFVWDSDGERDEGLPWYRPTRIYHITPGADCGWRSSGSGKVPPYTFDTIAPVAEAGRGSPTGVATYDHVTFPKQYHGGLFAADWTFGRIYCFHLIPKGATYTAKRELFLEASGTAGFAPVDIEVAPDGSMLVASGGRGLAGAVYKITPKKVDPKLKINYKSPIDAPSPLSAWSRERWLPQAKKISLEKWKKSVKDHEYTARHLDLLNEFRPPELHATLGRISNSPTIFSSSVKARAAYYSGHSGEESTWTTLLNDSSLRVQRVAFEAARTKKSDKSDAFRNFLDRKIYSDRRLQQTMSYILSYILEKEDPKIRDIVEYFPIAKTAAQKIIITSARIRQTPRGSKQHRTLEFISKFLSHPETTPEQLFDLLRLTEAAYEKKIKKRHTGQTFYEAWDSDNPGKIKGNYQTFLTKICKLKNEKLSRQSARLLGLLGNGTEENLTAILSRITEDSHPGEDVWTLSFTYRLKEGWTEALYQKAVKSFLDLPRKVEKHQQGRDRRWHRYVSFIWTQLIRQHPRIVEIALSEKSFGHPDHLVLAESMKGDALKKAIQLFAKRPLPRDIQERKRVLQLISRVPDASHRDLYIIELNNDSTRSEALRGLSKVATEADRIFFMDYLGFGERNLVSAALNGLRRLSVPKDFKNENTVFEVQELLRWGLKLNEDPSRKNERNQVAELLIRITGENAGFSKNNNKSQEKSFLAWAKNLSEKSEDMKSAIDTILKERKTEEDQLKTFITAATYVKGDAEKGRKFFFDRGCATCHQIGGKGQRIGPDLAGITRRFSPKDLIISIAKPNLAVANRYRTETVFLKNGRSVDGLAIYDSNAALRFMDREGQTYLFNVNEIKERRPQSLSLMPTGLLDGAKGEDIANMMEFLKSK